MPITIENIDQLINLSIELSRNAREFRFWSNHYAINKGEYSLKQKEHYLKLIDTKLKDLGINRTQRGYAIRLIIQKDKL